MFWYSWCNTPDFYLPNIANFYSFEIVITLISPTYLHIIFGKEKFLEPSFTSIDWALIYSDANTEIFETKLFALCFRIFIVTHKIFRFIFLHFQIAPALFVPRLIPLWILFWALILELNFVIIFFIGIFFTTTILTSFPGLGYRFTIFVFHFMQFYRHLDIRFFFISTQVMW